MTDLAKAFIGLGILLLVAGVVLLFASRAGLPLGRLPGDFAWRGKNIRFYFPLGTSILISLVLSVVLYLLSHLRR